MGIKSESSALWKHWKAVFLFYTVKFILCMVETNWPLHRLSEFLNVLLMTNGWWQSDRWVGSVSLVIWTLFKKELSLRGYRCYARLPRTVHHCTYSPLLHGHFMAQVHFTLSQHLNSSLLCVLSLSLSDTFAPLKHDLAEHQVCDFYDLIREAVRHDLLRCL